jgi:protein-S-isoprenylcysteine O-methyltransferase Ste14
MGRDPRREPGGGVLLLKNIFFTLLVPGTVGVYVPLLLAGEARWPEWGAAQAVALVPLALGTVVYLRCLWAFGAVGRGTPAPIDPPRRLVVTGLYRYVRNPMYLGVLLVIAGWVVFFQSETLLTYGAVTALVLHLFVVLIEEPLLRRKFGDAYSEYSRTVNRWLPKLAPAPDLTSP